MLSPSKDDAFMALICFSHILIGKKVYHVMLWLPLVAWSSIFCFLVWFLILLNFWKQAKMNRGDLNVFRWYRELFILFIPVFDVFIWNGLQYWKRFMYSLYPSISSPLLRSLNIHRWALWVAWASGLSLCFYFLLIVIFSWNSKLIKKHWLRAISHAVIIFHVIS